DDGGILGLACLEEFHDAGQTTSNVLGLGGFPRDLREDVSGLDFIAILNHQVGAGRHEVLLADLAGRIADQNRRLMFLVARGQGNNELRQAGDFVHLLFDGEAGAQIVKLHGAGGFGEDREREGIPFGKDLAVVDGVALGNPEARAVDHVVALFFAALFIHDDNQAGTIHGDESAATALNVAQVDEANDAGVLGFESGTLADAGGRTTNVEGAHGELRAGLAKLEHAAGGQVAPVAEGTNTTPGFAGEHRTDANALDAGRLNGVGKLLGNLLIDIDDDAAFEVLDLFEGDAANNAVAQRLDFDAGFDNGLDVDTVAGAAV